MKRYLLPETGTFYKANLHCHSNLSDGKLSPAQIKKIYMDDPDNYARYSQYFTESGAMYCIPVYDMSRDVNHCLMYREDVFEELGIEPWTDTASFLDALRKLKKAYPDSYPFTGSDFFQLLGHGSFQIGK